MASSFRAISLTGEAITLACFATSYRADFDGAGNATDALGIASTSTAILHTLHRDAAGRDWQAAVDSTLPGDTGTDSAVRMWLVSRGPQAMLGPAPPGQGAEMAVLHDRRLQQRAAAILERKTIFLLPEDPEKIFMKGKDALVDRLSDQLLTLLDHTSWPDFSFVRVGSAGKEKGMLDQILENLHGKMSADIFKDSPAEREGPVLICGLTGTGKTYGTRLFAKSLGLEFLPVNLSAVTSTTLESRLRGYVDGAYTGAKRGGAKGWFEKANGGILFLDEFQSVGLDFQIQLLDVLNAVSDRVELTRMGDEGTTRDVFKVKVVLAVNEDIGALRSAGRLRTDLFYRMRHILLFPTLRERFDQDPRQLEVLLNTYRWRSAPTIATSATTRHRQMHTAAERPDDLQMHRLRTMFPQFEEAAIAQLLQHDWPGNLRELERVASDLFWDADDRQAPLIALRDTTRAVARFQLHASPTARGDGAPPRAAPPELTAILSTVEGALQKHRFVIVRVLAELKLGKVYKITSPKTLKRFLDEHRRLLSASVASNPKVRKFMKWTDVQVS